MMMRGYELLIGYGVNVTCVCVCSGEIDSDVLGHSISVLSPHTHAHTPIN